MNFTAIDFETAAHDMPCQLGLVVVRDGQIAEENRWLIKPPGKNMLRDVFGFITSIRKIRYPHWNFLNYGMKLSRIWTIK
jgi:DNA polymerase III epsilon subunit-like protein